MNWYIRKGDKVEVLTGPALPEASWMIRPGIVNGERCNLVCDDSDGSIRFADDMPSAVSSALDGVFGGTP